MKKVIIVTVYVDAGSTRSRGLNTPINFPATVPLLKIIPTPFRYESQYFHCMFHRIGVLFYKNFSRIFRLVLCESDANDILSEYMIYFSIYQTNVT